MFELVLKDEEYVGEKTVIVMETRMGMEMVPEFGDCTRR